MNKVKYRFRDSAVFHYNDANEKLIICSLNHSNLLKLDGALGHVFRNLDKKSIFTAQDIHSQLENLCLENEASNISATLEKALAAFEKLDLVELS